MSEQEPSRSESADCKTSNCYCLRRVYNRDNHMIHLTKERISSILQIREQISHIKDIDSLLDRVLLEARLFTHADAGSIYLAHEQRLRFSYVQNDTLARQGAGNKQLYIDHEVPIDDQSIAGHVARTRKTLLVADAYAPDRRCPWRFNRSFDEKSGYHTQSVLTAPLVTSRDKLIGVMQMINAVDEQGRVVPFTTDDKRLVTFFGSHAAAAIERARTTREIILRMVKIAELRDPAETGAHANRVGAYAIEIYQRWAQERQIPTQEIKRVKDLLRIAAMLHDVGKVAISDLLLKKSGRLSDDEFRTVKWHTVYGARLFRDSTSDWDDMAAEIALNHHEKWDGSGYPGKIRDLFADNLTCGETKRGEEIPLWARIVALADVYDALSSKRVYKECWSEDRVLDTIRAEKGRHFDPEIVDAFFSIYDVIQAIRDRFRD
jgi:HD-GYP domain-containing protein (c-di-GMP phosphodiesterase class II)